MKSITLDLQKDKVHEECGVFGIYRNKKDTDIDIAGVTKDALFALQHRGQASCGIAINDNGEFQSLKDTGFVSEVMTTEDFDLLPNGSISIGHVRYHSDNTADRAGTQPLVIRYIYGSLAIAHNGAITNFAEIRSELEEGGAIFQSSSNSEIISYVIASERLKTNTIEEAVQKASCRIKGAYSYVVSSPSKLIGVRDPNGFRPLCIGKLNNSYVFTSESCVLDTIGAKFVRNVVPGEMVVVDEYGFKSYQIEKPVKRSTCIFEYIYFARPDSIIDGASVHMARREFGRTLAREYPVEADLVCGVPDSGIDAAQGFAEESGIPYGIGFIKNKYLGRTLGNYTAKKKERLLNTKLNTIKANVKGKRIVIIDDSIVKGSTSAHIVKLLRDAGVKEVHMRISSPPFKYPCYFGTDISSSDKLIANNMSLDEICKQIGADSLGYLTVDNLREAGKKNGVGICDACFSGDYPAEIPAVSYVDKFSKKITL